MRFALLGTGQISGWFAKTCHDSGIAEPAIVYSRSQEGGEEFARTHDIAACSDDLDAILADPGIDAVYVASPIPAHADQVRQALAAGKHVLCEKSLAVDLAEAQELVEAAKTADRVLLEAVRHIHDPAMETLRTHLPELGRIWSASFTMSQYSSRYDAFRSGTVLNAFNPEIGISALADVGIYPLHAAVQLFGVPRRTMAMTLSLPNDFQASATVLLDCTSTVVTCHYSKVTHGITPSVIEGEDATMSIDSIAEPSEIRLHYRDGRTRTLLSGPARRPVDTMTGELEEFARLVQAHDVDHRFHASTLAVQAIVDEITVQAGDDATPDGQAG